MKDKKIKVIYKIDTSLAIGYYSDSDISRTKAIVDKDNSTITNFDGTFPYVEINLNERIANKTMCVKDGVYQEFIKPDSELLQDAKTSKIREAKRLASDLIALSYPLHTQLNYLAEVSTIQDKQINGGALIQEELDLLDKAREVKSFINNIRTQSQNFVSQVESCVILQEVNNIDITY